MSRAEGDYAPLAAVAGLAREVEALRRTVDQAVAVADRVEELAALVALVVEETATRDHTDDPTDTPSWLDFGAGASEAVVLLDDLIGWMGGVYLRYTDAAQTLPACWLWHPDVVEELLWLMRAWRAAYQLGAAVSLAGDWHDRLRPGVVRRIKAVAGTCSLENHQPGGDRHTTAQVPPLADAGELIAAWWAASRQSEPPVPTEQHFAAAAGVRTRGGRK